MAPFRHRTFPNRIEKAPDFARFGTALISSELVRIVAPSNRPKEKVVREVAPSDPTVGWKDSKQGSKVLDCGTLPTSKQKTGAAFACFWSLPPILPNQPKMAARISPCCHLAANDSIVLGNGVQVGHNYCASAFCCASAFAVFFALYR